MKSYTHLITNFLTSEKKSFEIAKVAIVFQTIITSIVSICIFNSLITSTPLANALIWLLVIDILFVLAHLLYRRLYRGPKASLTHSQKRTLILHSATAITALLLTFLVLLNEEKNTWFILLVVLSNWITSLFLGIIFFIKKYVI